MKRFRLKQTFCLFLVAVLLTVSLAGCQAPNHTENPAGTSNSSTNPSILATDGVYEPEPSISDIWGTVSASFEQTYYPPSTQWAANQIFLPDAWDITTGSGTIRVGVIDSGIDASHPDLQNRVNTTLSESFIVGYSPLEDQLGHGTHIAGIIGAQGGNEIGITGVCWDVELVSLRVTDDRGDYDVETLIDAINSANRKDINILNISLNVWFNEPGYTNLDERLQSALADFDGLVVCSSGNANPEENRPFDNDTAFNYPANFHLDNLITVSASTNSDACADFSCIGELTVDIFAPGVAILSCYPTELCCNNQNCNSPNHPDKPCDPYSHSTDGYHLMSGTSMAAPHVAGVAALLLSIHPELTPAELKHVIMNSVDIIYNANGNSVFADLCVSGGRLNAYKALTATSIHSFNRWTDYNSTYHKRTCTICGYTEYGMHRDSTHPGTGLCLICGHSGSSTMSAGVAVVFSTAPVASPDIHP